jgi:Glycosyl hydrolases family 8
MLAVLLAPRHLDCLASSTTSSRPWHLRRQCLLPALAPGWSPAARPPRHYASLVRLPRGSATSCCRLEPSLRPRDPVAVPSATGQAFLDAYVDPDGRVVRRDQGGDTVSEGQAYALLIAVAPGDSERSTAVWTWTRNHLQPPDKLLSWR